MLQSVLRNETEAVSHVQQTIARQNDASISSLIAFHWITGYVVVRAAPSP
jgi:hypothetical protein